MQPFRKFPAFLRTGRLIILFTRALHWSLSWASSIQSILSSPISLRSILISFTHLRLGTNSGLLPFGFPTNILYALLFYLMCTTCPANLILLDLIILIMFCERSTSYEAPRYVVSCNLPSLHLSLVQIFSSAPCSQNTLSLCSSLNVGDQVSHPYRITGKIIREIFNDHSGPE
jgi:hypothetical protein